MISSPRSPPGHHVLFAFGRVAPLADRGWCATDPFRLLALPDQRYCFAFGPAWALDNPRSLSANYGHFGSPVISVVTPSFNQGVFLERTLRSLFDQDYPNLQLIVQDGG